MIFDFNTKTEESDIRKYLNVTKEELIKASKKSQSTIGKEYNIDVTNLKDSEIIDIIHILRSWKTFDIRFRVQNDEKKEIIVSFNKSKNAKLIFAYHYDKEGIKKYEADVVNTEIFNSLIKNMHDDLTNFEIKDVIHPYFHISGIDSACELLSAYNLLNKKYDNFSKLSICGYIDPVSWTDRDTMSFSEIVVNDSLIKDLVTDYIA